MNKMFRTNVVKGKFLGADGTPSGREYTFYIDEDVFVGDILEVFTRGRSSDVVITQINVDPKEIEPYKDIAKTLMPKMREIGERKDEVNE